jgi:hypothetical protein
MPHTDRLGRRRHASQHRGLRSLFPKLPVDVVTRALRIAMSAQAWQQLDGLAAATDAPTAPRQLGAVIEGALAGLDRAHEAESTAADAEGRLAAERPLHSGPRRYATHWLSWQAEKEQRLLGLH